MAVSVDYIIDTYLGVSWQKKIVTVVDKERRIEKALKDLAKFC